MEAPPPQEEGCCPPVCFRRRTWTGSTARCAWRISRGDGPDFAETRQRRSGSIVNISSVTIHTGSVNLSRHVASKGAVIGLTRTPAREVGEYNIHGNGITPGAVWTEAESRIATQAEVYAILGLQSLRRRILPVDIARVCLFLCCELSDAMTGQILNVDGGRIMH